MQMYRLTVILAALSACALHGIGQDTMVEASVMANASTGDFAPYYISALNHGKVTQGDGALIDIAGSYCCRPVDRMDINLGAEVMTGATARIDYQRWSHTKDAWTVNPQGPPPIWIQQLYADIKYRSLFVSLGLKEQDAPLVNHLLSSGDLIQSGNARPIPELRGGFNRFVSIPMTNDWVQVEAVLSYGKFADDKYTEHHYNYYNYHIASGTSYCYRRVFFRSNPHQRFVVVAGMQASSMFGGSAEYYDNGTLTEEKKYDGGMKSFFKMVIPVLTTGEDFVQGSTIGTWDFYSQYRLNDRQRISAYFQWPFEDGSGIALRNKLDGLWGIEYSTSDKTWVTGAVLEYIDFRDQSGPIHFAPGDHPNVSISSSATGRDNYYNNANYNAYANYGMSIGSPFLKSPIYNTDGYPAFTCNRANGIHIGIMGYITSEIRYRILGGYKRGLGTYSHPYNQVRTCKSFMAEVTYPVSSSFGIAMQVAGDRGDLWGNNFGAMVTLRYIYNNKK